MDVPVSWRTAVNFLQEYQGNSEPSTLKKAMRAYTGMALLNDVLASANANGQNPEVWLVRERFGITAPNERPCCNKASRSPVGAICMWSSTFTAAWWWAGCWFITRRQKRCWLRVRRRWMRRLRTIPSVSLIVVRGSITFQIRFGSIVRHSRCARQPLRVPNKTILPLPCSA